MSGGKPINWGLANSAVSVLSVLIATSGIALFISTFDLEPVHVTVIALIGLGGLISFYYLRSNIILGIYYWVILLWPYLFEVADHPVKTSYLVIPLLCFVILTIMLTKKIRFNVYTHPIFRWSVLYAAMMLLSTLFNLNHMTTATYSFLALWFLGVAFFVLYLGYINTLEKERVIGLAENATTVIMWMGLIAVIVAILEYYWPVEIHRFYNPRVGEESWGFRGGIEWFIDLKRGGSIIGAPNAFGIFLVITSIIAWHKWNLSKNVVFLGMVPIYFFGILLFSNSRQALIIFFIIFMLIFLRERKYILILFWGILSMSTFILTKSLIVGLLTAGRHYIANPLGLGPDIPVLGDRVSLWVATVYTLLRSPAHFMHGYGSSNNLMLSVIGKQTAHNIFLTALHFYGIPGLIILIMLIRSLLKKTKVLLMSRDGKSFLNSFYFILICMVLSSLVGSIFLFNPLITWIMFPMIAFLIRISILEKG